MSRRYCITIDIEPDCSFTWHRSNPLTFTSVTEGIPKLLRPIWDKYRIKPVYFVSPEVVFDDACCQVLKEEVERGVEIGAHLHSEYIAPDVRFNYPAGTPSKEYPCYAHSDKIEYEKLKNLTKAIKKNLGVRPVSYRAARFGADLATIKSLARLNYKVDSSVTPDISWESQGGPDHSRAQHQPYFVSSADYYAQGKSRILEVPITIKGKRLPFLPNSWLAYRWLRPTHMSVFEMRWLINDFCREFHNPVLHMMFHSMEIMPGKSPYVRSKIEQNLFMRRLIGVIRVLHEKGFAPETLERLYDEELRKI